MATQMADLRRYEIIIVIKANYCLFLKKGCKTLWFQK